MGDDSCGCEAVCSLPTDELQARVASVRAGLIPLIRRRTRLADGIAWEFDAGAAMRVRLEEFVEFERQCCSGLTFGIEEPSKDAGLRLTVRGPDARAFEALGGAVSEEGDGSPLAGGAARVAKAGAVGVLASLLLCCGLPLAVASVVGGAVAAPLARLDDPRAIAVGAVAIGVSSWMVMRRRSRAVGRSGCNQDC